MWGKNWLKEVAVMYSAGALLLAVNKVKMKAWAWINQLGKNHLLKDPLIFVIVADQHFSIPMSIYMTQNQIKMV